MTSEHPRCAGQKANTKGPEEAEVTAYMDFPAVSVRGIWVRSPVRELRSYMPRGMVLKKKKASCGAPMRGHKSSRFGNGSGFQGPGSFTPSGGSGKWEKVCLRVERTVGERAVSPKAQPSAER